MTLEEILTDRNRLSEDILGDVYKVAGNYGVTISRAEIKDLIFPGNLQEIMNKVPRGRADQPGPARRGEDRADVQRIAATAEAEAKRVQSEAHANSIRRDAEAEAEATRIKVDAAVNALRTREQAAGAYARHPALLRLTDSRPWPTSPARPTPGSTSASTSTPSPPSRNRPGLRRIEVFPPGRLHRGRPRRDHPRAETPLASGSPSNTLTHERNGQGRMKWLKIKSLWFTTGRP